MGEAELGRVDWVDVLEAAKKVTSMPLNNDIGSDMVVGLGKMGKLTHAEEAFQLTLQKQVDEPNSYLLNSMLTAYNRCGQPEKVLQLFQEYVEPPNGMKANRDTFRAVLVACGKLQDSDTALMMLRRMVSMGFKPELQACNAVLKSLSASNDKDAR